MNNSIEQTKKKDVLGVVAGIATAIAFVILIISGFKGIVGSIRLLTEISKSPYTNMGAAMASFIPAMLSSLGMIAGYILLVVYCVMSGVLNKKIKFLYIAGFAVMAVVELCAIGNPLISLFASRHFTFATILSSIVSVLLVALYFAAYLLAAITGFIKKPKASRIMGILAVVLFVIALACSFVTNIISVSSLLSYGLAWEFVKSVFLNLFAMIVNVVAVVGTLLFLRPVKK